MTIKLIEVMHGCDPVVNLSIELCSISNPTNSRRNAMAIDAIVSYF